MSAHLIDSHAPALDLFGPTVQVLTPLDGDVDDAPCLMRGTVPPGAIVPLHSHADPETFVAISGELMGLAFPDTWIPIRAGDIFHVPPGVKHAFRNRSSEPAVMHIVSTARIARFFEEVGAGSPEHFLATAERYGYWNATPEENFAIGLDVRT